MNLPKGTIVSAAGAVGVLVLFFLGPWHYRTVGPLGFGFSTGLDLAAAGQPLLYLVPGAAVLGLALAYVASTSQRLDRRVTSGLLLILGLGPAILVLIKLSELGESVGPIQIGNTGWGLWATIVALVVMAAGAIIIWVQQDIVGD